MDGIVVGLKKATSKLSLKFKKKDGDHEWHMIDATSIRAHHHAAGARGGQGLQALGRSCGGFSSKIHAKVDALGMPINFALSAGVSVIPY